MLHATLILGGLGAALLLGAAIIARCCSRWFARDVRDPGGLARLIGMTGVALLLLALLLRPYDPRTAAFPPPPDAAAWESVQM